jgi:heme exporter protein A
MNVTATSPLSSHGPGSALPRLTANRLACRRGTRLLFKGLDLSIDAGQIVWVRGRNGRGKTSLLRLAAGLSVPEDGQVLWNDMPVRRAAGFCERLVFIGHANALKDDLTVSESLALLLHIHGRLHDKATVSAALERMGLLSRRDAMVLTLSQGQRRRVALARLAAEREASLWILDEPFDALDVDGVQRLNGLLVEHRERGGSVLLTSHQPLDDALLQPQQVDLDAYA